MKWSLGVVKKLHVGKDGVPRAADLDTRKGSRTRAIQRLYNLEISEKQDNSVGDCNAQTKTVDNFAEDDEMAARVRPQRTRKLPRNLEDYKCV